MPCSNSERRGEIMNTKRDKFLTEAMGDYYQLFQFPNQNTNFSTWKGFGKLWNWAQKQNWWGVGLMGMEVYDGMIKIPIHFIHPDRFADAVYTYLKEGRDDE
jgi:predicted glycosyl hydrolase (DUF1957 family)